MALFPPTLYSSAAVVCVAAISCPRSFNTLSTSETYLFYFFSNAVSRPAPFLHQLKSSQVKTAFPKFKTVAEEGESQNTHIYIYICIYIYSYYCTLHKRHAVYVASCPFRPLHMYTCMHDGIPHLAYLRGKKYHLATYRGVT